MDIPPEPSREWCYQRPDPAQLADPVRDLADERDRREQVAEWLTQIATDAGLRGMEQLLHQFAEATAGP